MAKVAADPEQLQSFRTSLKAFNNELGQKLHTLKGNFRGLQSTWQDEQYRQFNAEFERFVREIEKWIEKADQDHLKRLDKHIQALREYQTRR